MNNLTIGPSKIAGKGVFALKEFQKGETVINWEPCSVRLTAEKLIDLPPFEKKFITNNTLLQSPNRFLNHSCDPNTKPINGVNIAIRKIKKGEEITTNYLEEKILLLTPMKCNCKNKKCKIIITKKKLT